jgi:hypothetical protein
LAAFFGDKHLSQINGQLCREYAATRPAVYSARRDLEELRAAINYHHREGAGANHRLTRAREEPALF